MASPQPALRFPSDPHVHVAGEHCPVCDQPIPNEKAEEIRLRAKARERELTEAANARAAQQLAFHKTQVEADASATVEQVRKETAEALRKQAEASAAKEAAALAAGKQQADAALQESLTAAAQQAAQLQEKCDAAERDKQVVITQYKGLKANHDTLLQAGINEAREVFEKEKTAAVLAEQAKGFDDKQKLMSTVQDLQRQLERQRADVLGEGAELNLYEELKAKFDDEGDRIRRVPKGTPGADVIHEIFYNGQLCGKIVYDSKNRNDWKTVYATKLCEDKIAERAQHAILSTLKFPAGAKQLHAMEGVILANPARVVVIAELLREHIVQTHGLRLSNHEQEKKQGALYAYIMSERFQQHLDSLDSQTDKLLDLDVDEQRAHQIVWEKRGKLLKALQKAEGNLRADVERIIGTDDPQKDDMTQTDYSGKRGQVIGLQERRLGPTVLRTYRAKLDIDDVVPNDRQPRLGPKEDDELQRQIEANEGLFEPLLVEPHPEQPGKYRIIDGERRWTNSKILVGQGRDQYREIPVEVTDRALTDEQRLRVWIYIHRQRKEWDAREKEMVAYRLVDLVGRASAANILGISVRELDKLVEVYELSARFTGMRDPAGGITWAREMLGVNKKLLTSAVVDAVVTKVNQKRITNSKELRKLRTILRDPVAREHFLSEQGDLDSAMLRLSLSPKKQQAGLAGDLDAAVEAMRDVSWTALAELKGDPDILKKIDNAEALLKSLRKSLTS